ncbi:sigma-70 family RNA polymerase sigma factor [Paenibacillaceae bacterium]|nr:sigma-70 family RNA polymerase sigma factor [Paenibacillaceae bacterium]
MEKQKNNYPDVESKWKALCDLCLTEDGRVVTSAEWQEEQRLNRIKEKQAKQLQKERESVQSWERLEFDTLNSLIIQYKQEGSSHHFNIAWHDFLEKLTRHYMNKFVIKGLPLVVKRLYLADHEAAELQDLLYPVLVKAIHTWQPHAPEHPTKDFAAYYGKAVEYYTGNIIRKYKRRKHEQLSLQYVDFYNEEELNRLLQAEPHFIEERLTGIEEWLHEEYLDNFIHDCLTEEQQQLFKWLYCDQLPTVQIAAQLNCSRMTIYRKEQQIKQLWQQYMQLDM